MRMAVGEKTDINRKWKRGQVPEMNQSEARSSFFVIRVQNTINNF